MMIAQWVSNSRARLSLEANYLLLLQAVLTFLPAGEKNTSCICLAAPFGYYISTEKEVSVCGRVASIRFSGYTYALIFSFVSLQRILLTFGIETYVTFQNFSPV